MMNIKYVAAPAILLAVSVAIAQTIGGGVGYATNTFESLAFSQVTPVTVANTASETALSSSTNAFGSLIIPANFFSIGRSLKITGMGFHSTTANPNITIKVKLDSAIILNTGANSSANSTNASFEIKGFMTGITTGASGTIQAQGFFTEEENGGSPFGMVNTSAASLDTTVPHTLSVTVQWGTASASNTITLTNLYLEAMN